MVRFLSPRARMACITGWVTCRQRERESRASSYRARQVVEKSWPLHSGRKGRRVRRGGGGGGEEGEEGRGGRRGGGQEGRRGGGEEGEEGEERRRGRRGGGGGGEGGRRGGGQEGRRGGGEEGEEGEEGEGEEITYNCNACKDCVAVLKAALTLDPGTAQGLVPVHQLTASAESFAL